MAELNQELTAPGNTTRPAVCEARFSVILPTDTFETIRGVLERLRRQTIREQIEVVLIAPSVAAVAQAIAYEEEFAAIKVVEYPVTNMAAARVLGIRSATAPILFIGETHSFPHPNMVEVLADALTGPWAAATPSVGNANPKGALSWAGLLADYAQWAEGLRPGESPAAPPYNAAYRRSMLLELGDDLEFALGFGGELPKWMRARGHRTYFAPSARIDHANVGVPSHWIGERFFAGWAIASQRARRWSLARRLAYIGGSGLIPVVLLWRVLPGILRTVRREDLPVATIPAVVLGAIVKAFGELCGYLGGPPGKAEQLMQEYEMHKLAYLA
jgi:hypothetical protein